MGLSRFNTMLRRRPCGIRGLVQVGCDSISRRLRSVDRMEGDMKPVDFSDGYVCAHPEQHYEFFICSDCYARWFARLMSGSDLSPDETIRMEHYKLISTED